MAESRRIQLSRRKGWRKPEGAVVVSRPTRWGNPWTVHQGIDNRWLVFLGKTGVALGGFDSKNDAQTFAVAQYRRWITDANHFPGGSPGRHWILDNLGQLAGKDLCCWCPIGTPCHADVLLELARDGES